MEGAVMTITAKLDKRINTNKIDKNPDRVLLLLRTLDRLPISLSILHKTKIGVTVNTVRKTATDEEIVSLSRTLVKRWKKLLSNELRSHQGLQVRSPSSNTTGVQSATGNGKENKLTGYSDSMGGVAGIISQVVDAVSQTDDPVRLKCRQLLEVALTSGELPEDSLDPKVLAAEIEDAIFQMHPRDTLRYKNRVRSRFSNLKDPHNPQLRRNVLTGNITSEAIAAMSVEDMASEELKKLRAKITQECLRDHQMAQTAGTFTDLFTCPRCRMKNCTYTQLQTRSADEPMTTFLLCNDCGNRWKLY